MGYEKKSVLKILFAALPLLVFSVHFSDAWRFGAAVCGGYWLTALFFKLTWTFFPRKVLGFAMILWLFFFGLMLWRVTGMTPYWLAGVYLLGPFEFSGKRGRVRKGGGEKAFKVVSNRFSKIFWRGSTFFLLMIFLGLIQEFLAATAAGGIFRHPAGVLFLLGIFSAMGTARAMTDKR
jgi:hypothetical protein